MEKGNLLKNYKTYICFAVLAIAMIVLYPQEGKFQYDYQKGRPWMYETLISPIDFPILKTQAEILSEKDEKASEMVDYFSADDNVGIDVIEKFNKLSIGSDLDQSLFRGITDILQEIYSKGVVSSFNSTDISDKVIFVKQNKRIVETPASEVYNIESAYDYLKSNLAYDFAKYNLDSLDHLLNLKSLIVPNLVYDEQMTQSLHKEAIDYISPTKGMVYAGQLIVSKGELVTADIEQLLDSYKAEYQMSFGYTGSKFSLIMSHILMVLAVVTLLFMTIFFVHPHIFVDMKRLIFILLLCFISYLATVLLRGINQQLLFLFPYAAFILYTASFFRRSSVYPVYLISLLPLLILSENGVELFLIDAVAGAIALLSFSIFSRGWIQFLNIIYIFAGMAVVYLSFKLSMNEWAQLFKSTELLFLLINAILVIVLYPFVFLFEKIFSLVSYSKLWDMTDTNNKLLQEMAQKAHGTFQHSIQVANLAENAARQIGANSMLVRVGALYHDVGKSKNPFCFIENQVPGVNDYHKDLTPIESARDIIRHVDDGIAIAKEYNLPQVVTNFIRSHHGTSQTLYFYNKYCNEGGDPDNKAPFTYDGILPTTKEQVILMMADAVEAASRSLKSYTKESISDLVDKILSVRLSDEQLSIADISISEINTIKESFKSYLMQIYHARIVYPAKKVKNS